MADAKSFDWRLIRGIAIAFLVVRLVLLVAARPYMDETYYWMWGQHPALSYFDHPSLIGWTQGLVSVFGWNIIALRLPVLLTLLGDLVLLRMLVRQTGRSDGSYWLIAAIFLSTPIFILITGSALPDHLLVFFSFLTVYAVERFANSINPRWLYLAGLAIGVATLSKYTGALLGLGVVAYLAANPRLRTAFRSPHLYLAALAAVILQVPVLIWNLQHDFASLGFIVQGRAGLRNPLSFGGLSGYLFGALAVLGPPLLWAMLRFATHRRDGHGYGRLLFWLSTLVFLAASLFTNILIHWNAIAYVAVLPFLLPHLRARGLATAQLAYGALALVFAAINFVALPITALWGKADRTSAWSYGWDEVADAVRALPEAQGIGFIATPNYALAGPLGFALRDPNVTSLSPNREAYDDWFDSAAHNGQSALIVSDRVIGLPDKVKAEFRSVVPLKVVEIERFGRPVETYTIYLGTAFAPG